MALLRDIAVKAMQIAPWLETVATALPLSDKWEKGISEEAAGWQPTAYTRGGPLKVWAAENFDVGPGAREKNVAVQQAKDAGTFYKTPTPTPTPTGGSGDTGGSVPTGPTGPTGPSADEIARQELQSRLSAINARLQQMRDIAQRNIGIARGVRDEVIGNIGQTYANLVQQAESRRNAALGALGQEDVGVQNLYGRAGGTARRAMESALTRNRMRARAMNQLNSSFYDQIQAATTEEARKALFDLEQEQAAKRAAIGTRRSETEDWFNQQASTIAQEEASLKSQAEREYQNQVNAAQKGGSFLSQPISLGSQLLSNRTFYGAPIYEQEDTALQKIGKLGGYALEESSHPLIGEPIAVAQGRKTPFEAGLGIMEVPAYPSASTPEKPLPLARVADTQTLAAGQPGTLARTTEEGKPSFLESLFSLRKKEEPLRELPAKTEELAIVYGDARKILKNYDERRTRIEYGQYTSENKRRQALTELEEERAYAQAVLERIEAEKPEQVFEIGLQTYATGQGMSVEERSEWAAGELGSSVDEAEFSKKLEAMLEAGVITKDVATALREEYGLPVYQYKSGGKIVSAGGGGSGGGTSKGDLTKILNAIQSDYEATKKLYQKMATPSSQPGALEAILKLYGQRGTTRPPTRSSLEEILATRRRMEPIAKIE